MRLNLGGHRFLWQDGYGRFSLAFARVLLQAGHDVYPFELSALDKPGWFLRAQGMDFSRVTLQLAPPNQFRHVPGRSVAWTMHESTQLPEGWAEMINQTTQFCAVPHPWLIPVFEQAGVKVPISVVPGGIDPAECPIQRRSGSQPYTFIALADRGGRKGHSLVYTAFYKAFPHNNRDVRLILKCRPGSLNRLDFSFGRDPRVTVWREDVERIADVFAFADAAINPNHCEGYGMWPREAAACGLPVVVTPWSGTDDETDQWAIPIKNFRVAKSGMRDCGGQWAYPSEEEVCEHMRWLYNHQDEGRKIGLRSARWLRANRTYAHAARTLLQTLAGWMGGPLPDDMGRPSPEDLDRERQLLEELEDA